MESKNVTYHALTIGVASGKTYWNKSSENYQELIKHLRRYLKRDCHVVIYRDTTGGIEFVKHISHFNFNQEQNKR
tara:strand:- start:992 stop:1216 length:225 start_codon:yes stop_codon:yes gene_type:complete